MWVQLPGCRVPHGLVRRPFPTALRDLHIVLLGLAVYAGHFLHLYASYVHCWWLSTNLFFLLCVTRAQRHRHARNDTGMPACQMC